MSVATALYQQIYCRYLCPGEAIVHDRGPEFCNQIVRDLQEHFGVNIRVISAGKPRANGSIETGVNLWKSRGRALMAEGGNVLVLKKIFLRWKIARELGCYVFPQDYVYHAKRS